MAKLLQFLQGQPKAAFSEKAQTKDQGKFKKKTPKKKPSFERPKRAGANGIILKLQRT